MKRIAAVLIVVAAPILLAALILVPGHLRAKHAASLFVTWNSLKVAAVDLQTEGKFTNHYPQVCRISTYTNCHAVSGTIYQCLLAADSWDYRGRGNLLAVTTNGPFLFIDRQGALLLKDWHDMPGY